MLSYLIDQGANVRITDLKLRNILHLSMKDCCSSFLDNNTNNLAHEVLDKLYKVNTQPTSCLTIDSNFIFFCQNTHYAELLEQRDVEGLTVMHYLGCNGNFVCLDFLVNHGAEINAKCNMKKVSLFILYSI